MIPSTVVTKYPSPKLNRSDRKARAKEPKYALGAAWNCSSTIPYRIPAPSSIDANQVALRNRTAMPVMIASRTRTTAADHHFVYGRYPPRTT